MSDVLNPQDPNEEAKKRDVPHLKTGVDSSPVPQGDVLSSPETLPVLQANTLSEDGMNNPLVAGNDEDGDPLPPMPTQDLAAPNTGIDKAEGDLFNPRFPVPVNVQYDQFNTPTMEWDKNPLDVISQSKDAVAEQLKQQKEWTDQKVIESIFKDDTTSPSINWYPEGYYDLKDQSTSAEEFFSDYTRNQLPGTQLNTPPISGSVGEDHITTATQNAVQARGGMTSRIGQEIQQQAQQNKEPLGFFQGTWEGAQAWAQLPGIALRGIDAFGNAIADAFTGKKIDRRQEILTEGNKREIGEALSYLQPNPNLPPGTPPKADFGKGDFGHFGRGSMGLGNYLFNLPQQVLSSLIYDVGDVVTGRYQGNPLNKRSRLADALQGEDYGFFNPRTERRYLSPVTNPKDPVQWGVGFIMDMVTGGVSDSLVSSITGSGKVASATSRQLAARAPDFTAETVAAATKKVGLTITAEQAQEAVRKARLAIQQASKTPTPSAVTRDAANQAVTRAARTLQNTPKEEIAKYVARSVLPESLSGKSPQALAQTTRLVDIQTSFAQASKRANQLQTELRASAERLQARASNLDAAPNLERSSIVNQLQSQQVLGGIPHPELLPQPKVPFVPGTPVEKLPPSKLAQGINALPMYHGTKLDIEDLKAINPLEGSAPNELGVGIYFTTNRGRASNYAMAQPQINKPPVPTARYFEDGSGAVHEVSLDIRNPLDASIAPTQEVRKVFVDATKQFLDPQLTRTYIARISNQPLEKHWNTFREVWSELNPGQAIPEDIMLQFQRQVSGGLSTLGFDAVIKKTPDDVIVNVLKGADDLPVNQMSKVPLGTGDLLEQKANRLAVDEWSDNVFQTQTSSVNKVQSQLSLEAESAARLQDEYIKAEKQATDLAENLADAEDELTDIVRLEKRDLTQRITTRGQDQPIQELNKKGFLEETDKPCL